MFQVFAVLGPNIPFETWFNTSAGSSGIASFLSLLGGMMDVLRTLYVVQAALFIFGVGLAWKLLKRFGVL